MVLRDMGEADAEAVHAIHGACPTGNLLGRGYTRRQIEARMAGRTPGGHAEVSRSGERFLVAALGGRS